MTIPKVFIYAVLIIVTLALVPPAIIARSRAVRSKEPRIHYIQDMDNQAKFRAQHANPLFADGRAMRPPVTGTVSRREPGEAFREDEHFERGIANGQWATTFPDRVEVTMQFLERGRERFGIYCQPCHGVAGYGDGLINKRAMELVNLGTNGTVWVQPKSVHEEQIREQPVGQLYNTVANGVRNMPGYSSQIPVADRWAIVAYLRALQRSQNARESDMAATPPAGADRIAAVGSAE